MTEKNSTLRILLAALGGEGGGVLMNWIVAAARNAGFDVQATSVPGVAQRTGSTSYYVEVAEAGRGKQPVLNLVPMPGRVDVVVASELMEAARVMDAGYVSPSLTTLISSTSRLLTIGERIEMGDGRFGDQPIVDAAEKVSKDHYILDLGGLAEAHKTFISATMFGALAGSGVLPWDVNTSKGVLGSGKIAEASSAGFQAALAAVEKLRSEKPTVDQINPQKNENPTSEFPSEVGDLVEHGIARCVDFQDAAYGKKYLGLVRDLASVTQMDEPAAVHALGEASRRLALWMAYEDVARVADLKTRPERFERIRKESQMRPDQIFRVVDYMKPRGEEIADILPIGLGKLIMRRVNKGKGLPFLNRGIHIRSNGVFGNLLLRSVAGLRRIRRKSLRYSEEMVAIDLWHKDMKASLQNSSAFSGALAELPRVLKGYSDTLQRGKTAYNRITASIVRPCIDGGTEHQNADRLRAAIAAALADDNHKKLDALLQDFTQAA